MENIWKITYIKNNNPVVHFFNSKIHAISEYVNILNVGKCYNKNGEFISELKILKNDKDYTNTLNKFLYK